MSDFKELLKRLNSFSSEEDLEKKQDCPDESLLIELAHGKLSSDQKSQAISHIIGCTYCALFFKACILNIEDEIISDELTKDIFPLEKDINWSGITSLILYSVDNKLEIPIPKNDEGIYKIDINSSGAYAVKTNTGQYLWSRILENDDLILTKKDMHELPLAADMKDDSTAITSISEPLYDGRLHIRLVKGLKFGTLEINIISITK